MDIHKAKMLQRLRGSYHIGMLLTPLLDACQRQRISSENAEVSSDPGQLLKTVFAASNKVYQEIAQRDNLVTDPTFVMNALNITLSKALRNNIVMYGSSDLEMLTDDVVSMFSTNLQTLQQWAGPAEKEVSGNATSLSNVEKTKVVHDVIGYIATHLLTLLMPFFLFHANLHLVGKVDVAQLQELNTKCSNHMLQMVSSLREVIESQQSGAHSFFSVHSTILCSELCAMHCHELHARILRSNDDVDRYIRDPLPFLTMIAPSVMSSFSIINTETLKVMSELMTDL